MRRRRGRCLEMSAMRLGAWKESGAFLPKPMPFSMGGVMKAITKLLRNRLVPEYCAVIFCAYFIQFALALIDVPERAR